MRRLALLLALLLATGAATPVAAAAPAHTVTYDRYSLKVDGERVVLWSGEFHYFRLPSPALWRDALEKIRAAGFNGVSLYFNWAYHSPAPASTTSPACGTWTGCCGSPRNWACMWSHGPARTSTPRSAAAVSPRGSSRSTAGPGRATPATPRRRAA